MIASDLFGGKRSRKVLVAKCLNADSETFLSNQKVQQHQESFQENTPELPKQTYRSLTKEEEKVFEVTSFFCFFFKSLP